MGESVKGTPVVILGAARFDSPIESTSLTLARYLANNRRVYYIDYPFTWKDCIKLRKTVVYQVRKPAFHDPGKRIVSTNHPNLKIVILPPVASINFLPEGNLYRFLLRRIEGHIRKNLKEILRAEKITDFTYINSYNFHYPGIANGLNPTLTVYQSVDPLIGSYDRKHGRISEDRLVTESDLVVCTSKQLFQEKGRQNPSTHFIPNAADVSHSQKALDPELPVHPLLNGIPRPVIGYFGNIERRMDFDLLQQVIESNPDKSFVFAGPVDRQAVPGWFFSAANVHFTGLLPYEEMPAMIKGFDVALIPFRKDAYSRTIFPLKLFEYLGAGKPVVATDFNPDLREFTSDTVHYCDTPEAFSNAIIQAAISNTEADIARRLKVASANTWARRAEDLEDLLDRQVSGKINNR